MQAHHVASRPNMHRSEKIRTPCPNWPASVHVQDGGIEERPNLSVDEIRRRLHATDLHAGGASPNNAKELGRRYRVDSDDLLQGAIVRSLCKRTCRPDLPVELFLTQIMRSVGSSVARARVRAQERRGDFEYLLGSQIAAQPVLGAEERLRLEAERRRYAGLLDEIAGGDELLTALIDGIGQGLCGSALAEFLDIDQAGLAAPRRTLKRRAQAIARRERLFRADAKELPEEGRQRG